MPFGWKKKRVFGELLSFYWRREARFCRISLQKTISKVRLGRRGVKSGTSFCPQSGRVHCPEISRSVAENQYGKLAELNPDLQRLNYDKRSISYRALIGITSQYNVNDINSYLHSFRTKIKNPDSEKRMAALKEKGFRFGWIPSSETLAKIEKFAKEHKRIASYRRAQSVIQSRNDKTNILRPKQAGDVL